MPAESPLRDRLGPDDGLIETLGFLPGEGVVRLERHLARLGRSAGTFGIAFDATEARERVASLAKGDKPLRLRLLLNADGRLEATAAPFVPTSPDAVWRLRMASARLSSGDALLAHKTTRRSVYAAARAEFAPSDADEVILLNERGEICEGTITSFFMEREDGKLVTPALACGLLAGVLRGELIEAGQCFEAVLTPANLARARAFYVGNSLRGLIRAQL